MDDHALLVDEEGRGCIDDAVVDGGRAIGVEDVEIGNTVLLQEAETINRGVLEIDTDENNTLCLSMLRLRLQERSFVPARATGGGPEVEDDGLAFEVRKANSSRLESGEGS